MIVRLPAEERGSEAELGRFIVRGPGGGESRSSEAAEIERGRAYEEIRRTDGRRVLNVTADIVPGAAQAPAACSPTCRKGLLADAAARLPGARRLRSRASSATCASPSAASGRASFSRCFVLFAMLAVPFRSYLQALMVMLAIPFGIVGAVVGHWLMRYELSFISVMGMVALAGRGDQRQPRSSWTPPTAAPRGHGPAGHAMARAPVRRFRPMLLTSLTTFFGLAPIIFETSIQARFMIPMAISLGFGILFSTAITLVLVPAFYTIVEDIRQAFRRRFPVAAAE